MCNSLFSPEQYQYESDTDELKISNRNIPHCGCNNTKSQNEINQCSSESTIYDNYKYSDNYEHDPTKTQFNQTICPKCQNQIQFLGRVQCCDYYNSELQDVISICMPNPNYPICDDYIYNNGYKYDLIVQSTLTDCGQCWDKNEIAKRLGKLPMFKGKKLVLTQKNANFKIL